MRYKPYHVLKIALMAVSICSLPLSAFSQTAKENFLRGNEYLQRGNYQQAIIAYQQTIKLNPYHKTAYHNLGKCYLNLNLFNKAEGAFKKALSFDPNYIESLNKLGVVYEHQKKHKEAYGCYRRVLEVNPIEAEAHYNLASLFQKNRDFEKAILHAKRAIKTKPDYAEAFIKLGEIYWKAYRDMDKASLYYKKAKEIEPENRLVRSYLAEMYTQEGLTEDAEREYVEIININPLSLSALSQLVKTYTYQMRYEKIGPLCQRIIGITPQDTEFLSYTSVLSSLITLFIEQGMEKNASLLSQRLISLTPTSKTFDAYLSTLTNLITLMFDQGNYEKASTFCKRITTLVPPNKALDSYYDTLNRLIRLYFSHKRYRDAIPLCQRAIAISPLDKIAHYQLSLAYRGMGEYKGCVNAAIKACRMDPFDEICWQIVEKGILELDRQQVGTPLRNECSKRHIERAQYYLGLGNPSLTEYEYKKARQLNPQSVPARVGLARYYEGQGLLPESVEELKRVLELDPENIEAKDKIEMNWKQSTSSLVKEPLPEVKKRRVAVIFSAKKSIHLEIDTLAGEVMKEFLAKSFTVIPVASEAHNLPEAIQLAKGLQASYLLYGEIEEAKERTCIESQLLNLKGKKVKEFLNISRSKDGLVKCISYLSKELSDFFPVQGEIVSLNRTSVALNLGEKHGVKNGFICDALDTAGKRIAEIEIVEVSNNASRGIITSISGMRHVLPHNRVSLRKGQVAVEKKEKKGKKK